MVYDNYIFNKKKEKNILAKEAEYNTIFLCS